MNAVDAQAWDERYQDDDLVWTGMVNMFVLMYNARLEPGEAIDVGAGEGRNAVWLAQRGWEVTAVDFSAVAMEKARELAFDAGVEIATVVGDALEYQPPSQVDLVLLCYLQLPDAQQVRVLREAATWLKPGGRIMVIAHDKSNVEHGHGGPQDVGVCYSVDNTVAALSALRIDLAEVATRPIGDAVALDTLVIATREQ